MGYPNIDQVYGEIKIYDSSLQQIASIQTERRSLAGLQTITFSPSFNTQKWPPSVYSATATVWYDQKLKTTNASFMIGQQDITLLNYTRELNPGFSEFEILLQNNWGRELSNVYATLSLNNTELLQTPSINLQPWSQGKLKGIVKIDLAPAEYQGKIVLHFDDKAKEIPITISVLLPEEKDTILGIKNEVLWGSIWVLIIVLVTLGIVYAVWNRNS